MPKLPRDHPYTDRAAFERLLVLLATLVQYPGVGALDQERSAHQEHNALEEVQHYLKKVASEQGIALPDYSTHTLRKDLVTLRRYGILDSRMYRWGYYLGTGVFSQEELQVALNALAIQAKDQGDPQLRQIYQVLAQRLRGLDLELKGELFYPVRQQLNRPVGYTDPDEMMALGKNQDTLFHQLDVVEQAIIQGQGIELSRSTDPYGKGRVGSVRVIPLQLIYHDIAWYLLYEQEQTGHLAAGRVNRFKNYCRVFQPRGRGLQVQTQRLQLAHQLLDNGWGLFLGEPEDQRDELQGRLPMETVKVRFFAPVVPFILEGDRRHPQQKIQKGPKDPTTGQLTYVDYIVTLPPRSLPEFSRWVYRHMHHAQILAPESLVAAHKAAISGLVQRYDLA